MFLSKKNIFLKLIFNAFYSIVVIYIKLCEIVEENLYIATFTL